MNLLPEKHKNQLVTTINWFLQDNFIVNQLIEDKHYMVEKFTNIIMEFANLFLVFSSAINYSDSQKGLDEIDILKFYEKIEKSKKELFNIVNSSSSDLFSLLMRHFSV